MADLNFCIDTLNRPREQPVGKYFVVCRNENRSNFVALSISGVYYCGHNKKRPQDNQHFTLRYYRDIAMPNMQDCFDSYGVGDKRELKTHGCHNGQGNQYFRYDLKTMQIHHGSVRNQFCVEVDVSTQSVFVTRCVDGKLTQKWKWGFVNETNVRNWLHYGSKIVDAQEITDLSKLMQ